MGERIKIKEDCIKKQISDNNDQIMNLNNEFNKTLGSIGFMFTILTIGLDGLNNLNICYKIFLIFFVFISLFIAFLNFKSKTIEYYFDVSKPFYDEKLSYEKYLEETFKLNNKAYKNITKSLKEISEKNNYLYICISGLLIYIIYLLIF